MKHLRILSVIFLMFCFSVVSEAADPKAPPPPRESNKGKERVVQSEIGLKIPEWGIAIDAIYNPELTDIIPGYHILNLVLTNSREDPIELDSKLDKWIVIDNAGKRHMAYNHIKQFDKNLWPRLPERLQSLLDYPNILNPGKSTTVDVFLPKSVDLTNFREVVWKSAHFKKEFNLMTRYEKNLNIPSTNSNEFTVPKENEGLEESIQSVGDQEQLQINNEEIANYPSKYMPPKIGEVQDQNQNNNHPTFDPSLDDTITIR